MTIKTVSTYHSSFEEIIGTMDNVHDVDRSTWANFPPGELQTFLLNAVTNGTLPGAKQAGDTVTRTDTTVTVTSVW
jgi:hypothetical protein